MWSLVLKVSSKEIQLCNRNLYLMDGLTTTTFFSFKIACMCHRPAVVEGQFRLPYNSANVRPSVMKSLPYKIIPHISYLVHRSATKHKTNFIRLIPRCLP